MKRGITTCGEPNQTNPLCVCVLNVVSLRRLGRTAEALLTGQRLWESADAGGWGRWLKKDTDSEASWERYPGGLLRWKTPGCRMCAFECHGIYVYILSLFLRNNLRSRWGIKACVVNFTDALLMQEGTNLGWGENYDKTVIFKMPDNIGVNIVVWNSVNYFSETTYR